MSELLHHFLSMSCLSILYCLRAWILCEISCKTIKAFFSFIVVPPCCHPSDQICKLQRLIHWASRVLKSLLMPVSQRWKLMQFLVKDQTGYGWLAIDRVSTSEVFVFSHVDVYRASIGCLFSHGSEKTLEMVGHGLILLDIHRFLNDAQLYAANAHFHRNFARIGLAIWNLAVLELDELKESSIFPPDLRSMYQETAWQYHGEILPCGLTVWAAGQIGQELVQKDAPAVTQTAGTATAEARGSDILFNGE